MGTRGVYGFKYEDKYYVTYNHFDSYPEGLGLEIVKFIESVTDWENLKKDVKNIKLVQEDALPTSEEIQQYKKYINTDVGDNDFDYYKLLHKAQFGVILYSIKDGNTLMIDSYDFLCNSLFCEYAYIIDLDTFELLYFEGFKTEFQKNNVLPFKEDEYFKGHDGTKYYCVHLMNRFDLNNIDIAGIYFTAGKEEE